MLPVKLYVSKILRNETSITSQHKTINYLDNILAKNEAKNNGYDDVLFLNSKKEGLLRFYIKSILFRTW